MNEFALVGVSVLGLLAVVWIGAWLWEILRDPIGQAFLAGVGILLVVVWGVFGGIWLLAQ